MKMKTVKYYYSAPVHIRHIPVLTDDEGNVLFIYDKVEPSVKRVPRITVASVYDPIDNKMTFGAAVCSPKDTFKKSIGREIAEKRARHFAEVTVVAIDRRKIREVSQRYANDLIERHLSKYIQFDQNKRYRSPKQ
jgi:hypothetical protein